MKLIILNRDGVINEAPDGYIKSPQDWQPIEGSLEAIVRANSAGYHVVVATNQPALGEGKYNIDDLDAIHQKLYRELSVLGGHIDAIFFCPHAGRSACQCRLPRPGLLKEIGARFHTNLQGVPFIGDSLSDVDAALAAGADPILVRTGNWPATKTADRKLTGVPIYENMATAIDILISLY